MEALNQFYEIITRHFMKACLLMVGSYFYFPTYLPMEDEWPLDYEIFFDLFSGIQSETHMYFPVTFVNTQICKHNSKENKIIQTKQTKLYRLLKKIHCWCSTYMPTLVCGFRNISMHYSFILVGGVKKN